jgi:hypothetical protein
MDQLEEFRGWLNKRTVKAVVAHRVRAYVDHFDITVTATDGDSFQGDMVRPLIFYSIVNLAADAMDPPLLNRTKFVCGPDALFMEHTN